MSEGTGAEPLRRWPERRVWLLLWALTALAGVGFAVLTGTAQAAAAGEAAGGVNGAGAALPVLQLLTYGAGIVTFGFLLAASFLDPQGSKGYVSRPGRRDLLVVSRAAAVWAVLALLTALVTFADFVGLPLGQALEPSTLTTYFWAVPQVEALMVSALLALVIALSAPFTSALGAAVVAAAGAAVGLAAPSLAVHPTSLGDHSLSMTA
ncbi:MAG: hypothetical protein ABI468_11920, partial [Candidatus Nanopelagicales bacterium]